MSQVKLVPNKTASKLAGKEVMFVPTSSGKFYRVQVSSKQSGESVDSNGNGTGFNTERTRVGFSYHSSEASAQTLIASAVEGMIAGKVIYVDQLEPIATENAEYGKQYPYPFRFNGQELSLEQRLLIQQKAAETGRCLTQSGRPIYRRKIHTTIMDSKDVVLSPDNNADIQSFIAQVLATSSKPTDEQIARFNELKALGNKRNATQKAEYAELLDIVGA